MRKIILISPKQSITINSTGNVIYFAVSAAGGLAIAMRGFGVTSSPLSL